MKIEVTQFLRIQRRSRWIGNWIQDRLYPFESRCIYPQPKLEATGEMYRQMSSAWRVMPEGIFRIFLTLHFDRHLRSTVCSETRQEFRWSAFGKCLQRKP